MRRAFCSALLVVLVAASSRAGVVPIADVKQIDASGTPVLLGQTVAVSGVVTVGSGVLSAVDLDVYIQDATAGINIFKKNAGSLRLKLGDSVVVTGLLDQGGALPTRGNTKINVQEVTVAAKTSPPAPLTVTAGDLGANAVPPLEPYEGMLVRVEHVTFDPADWPAAGIDWTLSAQDPTGSLKLRIDRDTGIGGTEPPRQPFIAIGVVVQDAPTAPLLSGYTVWPRSRSSDFLMMGAGSGIAAVEPSVVETNAGPFDLTVTLSGNLADTIRAFSIDLPLSDGWGWPGRRADLSGPGLADATYEITAGGVQVSSAVVFDASFGLGAVTFRGISPPPDPVSSVLTVRTSVDGALSAEIANEPSLRSVYPRPPVVVNEIFPNDGSASKSDAFVELYNGGATTAYLQGFVLCEARVVPYCDTEIRYTFAVGDSIPAGGYLVIAESGQGFAERFGSQPSIQAGVSPLGRVSGDGGICDGAQTYEAVSLWRDGSLTDLIDCMEYRDGVACSADLCDLFGAPGDAYPYIPPKGYAIVSKTWPACCPYQAVSASPTPGSQNHRTYLAPTVLSVISHSQNVLEVFFSEPLDPDALKAAGSFLLLGAARQAQASYLSLSGEKVLLLFDDLPLGAVDSLKADGLLSWAGVGMCDAPCPPAPVVISISPSDRPCDIQAFDSNGYSPMNGKIVTMFGFITVPPLVYQPDYQSIYVQGLDGCGINVFSYDLSSPLPKIGDFVSVAGEVTEYISSKAGSSTEISMASGMGLGIKSRGYPEPPALVLSTGEVGKEENEGRLVQAEGTVVNASDFSFYIDDGSGGIQVYQNYLPIDFSQYHTGMSIRVKGVILQYDYTLPFLEGYELVPRYDSDIVVVGGAFAPKPALGVEPRVFCPSCGEPGFRITYGAPSLASVTLRIFDGAGRLIATLYDGASVGRGEVTWTGRDDEGEPLAPGLYVCHLEVVEAGSGRTGVDSAPIIIGIRLR